MGEHPHGGRDLAECVHRRCAAHRGCGSGDALAGRWVEERRNVRADFKALFGKDVRYVDAVAIMSDTDNTGGSAVAYYGDITFRSE